MQETAIIICFKVFVNPNWSERYYIGFPGQIRKFISHIFSFKFDDFGTTVPSLYESTHFSKS